MGGVVDAGYRGEVFVGLVNTGTEVQSFAAGEKVAQIIIQKIEQPTIELVNELDETDRGEGAFGSTGK
jgi:dUTP pyrophosphatase